MENIEKENIQKDLTPESLSPEEARSFLNYIRNKSHRALYETSETSKSKELDMKTWDKISDFVNNLKRIYGEKIMDTCAAYHGACGSSIVEDEDLAKIKIRDFPGEHSIENFLDKLLQEK